MDKKIAVFLFTSYFCSFVSAVDMDYFFSGLRDNGCYSVEGLRNCKKLCHDVPVVCHEGECYCHQSVVHFKKTQYEMASLDLKQQVQIQMKPIYEKKKIAEDVTEAMLNEEGLRPALRHQIAHFCPSLNDARKCIKKCMKEGKPAFCGKDHTCYCGHKYGHHDSNDKNNALDTYKHYADMYTKYLGTPVAELSDEGKDKGSDEGKE